MPHSDERYDWQAQGLPEKPWWDYSQLLEKFGIKVGQTDPGLKGEDYWAEDDRLFNEAIDAFYEGIYGNQEKIDSLRKLLTDLAWWNHTTLSDLWGFIAKMDDETMLKVCRPLFGMLWD